MRTIRTLAARELRAAVRGRQFLVSAATLAIMNDHAIDEQPKPGERLKIVVAGS